MKKLQLRWTLGFLLLFPSGAWSGPIDQLKNQFKNEVVASTVDLRLKVELGNDSDPNLPERDALRTAEGRYKALLTEILRLEVNQKATPQEKVEFLNHLFVTQENAALRSFALIQKHLDNILASNPAESDVARIFANQEAEIRVARTQLEIIFMQLSAHGPLVGPREFGERFFCGPGSKCQLTLLRMDELGDAMEKIDVGHAADPVGGVSDRVYQWYSAIQMGYNLEEYRRLAVHGLILDQAVEGKETPVVGAVRQQIARNAELNLVARLNHHSRRLPLSRFFWPSDSREDVARQLEREVLQTPEYQLLNYLIQGRTPTVPEYYNAVARVIISQQQSVNDWFVKEYGREGLNKGLGMILRYYGAWGTGSASYDEVSKRIQQFTRESDAAASAFQQAARTPDPAQLPLQTRQLLENYGYIETHTGGLKTYVIPTDSRTLSGNLGGMQQKLNLPGEAWLNIITPKNIGIAVVSVVAPELIGLRIAAAAEALSLSEGTVIAVQVLAEMVAGAALSAGQDYLEHGKVDLKKIMIESFLLGSVLQGITRGTQFLTPAMARAVENWTQNFPFQKLLKDRAVREATEEWIQDGLSLAADGFLNTYYLSEMEGKVDIETFLSVMFNSVITRHISNAFHGRVPAYSDFAGWMGQHLPPALKRYFETDPRMMRHTYERVQEQLRLQAEASRTLSEVLKNRKKGDLSRDLVFRALKRGDLSFNDIRVLVEIAPTKYRAVAEEIRELREVTFKGMEHEAVTMARDQVRRAFQDDRKKVEERFPPGPERDRAIEALENRTLFELSFINKNIIAPGSKDPTSDIDRSSAHPLVRKLLVRLYEAQAQSVDGGRVPPSARAFDVNEYINIFYFLNENIPLRTALDAVDGPVAGIKHGQWIESESLAGAMLHMSEGQRRRFESNQENILWKKFETENTPPAERARILTELNQKFDRAENSLFRGQQELAAETRELGLDPQNPDSELRARESLYDKRVRKYQDQLWEIQMKELERPGSALAERAALERDMVFFLREGIETYCNPTGLDIVVTRLQAKKTSPGKALLDPQFTVDGDLSVYRKADFEGMVQDQILLMMEHVNAYHHGHELVWQAGRAIAKYGERILLARHIQGLDFVNDVPQRSPNDPIRRLFEATQNLVAFKADPDGFQAILKSLSPVTPRTAHAGLMEYLHWVELAEPQLKNLLTDSTDALPNQWKPSLGNPSQLYPHIGRLRRLLQREEKKVYEMVLEKAGALTTRNTLEEEVVEIQKNLSEVLALIANLGRVSGEYDEVDWVRVLELEQREREIKLLLASFPGFYLDENYRQLQRDLQQVLEQLRVLREKHQANPNPTPIDSNPEYRRLWLQRYELEAQLQEKQRWIERVRAREALDLELNQVNLAGVWEFGPEPTRPGKVRLEHVAGRPGKIKLWITWQGQSEQPPHYEVNAIYTRGEIYGFWKDLHTSSTVEGGFMGGIFRARYSRETGMIQVILPTTESARNGGALRWNGAILRRNSEIRAPSGRPYFETENQSIAQEPIDSVGRYVGQIPAGKGILLVNYKNSKGRTRHLHYDLYEVDSPPDGSGWVEDGQVAVYRQVPAGTYDLVVESSPETRMSRVTVQAGRVNVVEMPGEGRVRLEVRGGPGDILQDARGVDAAVFGNNQWFGRPGATVETALELPAGTYTFVSAGLRETITVKSMQETVVALNYAKVDVRAKDGLGQPITDYTFQMYQEENMIHPIEVPTTTPGSKTMWLPPGRYRARFLKQDTPEQWISPVDVFVHESTKVIPPLGRLKVTIQGKRPPATARAIVRSKTQTHRITWMDFSKIDSLDLPVDRYEVNYMDGDQNKVTEIDVGAFRENLLNL
mgnify:CR=1 FL=1